MLDKLFGLLKTDKLMKIRIIMGTVEDLVSIIHDEFRDDVTPENKNTAIDTVIKLLECHKS